MPQITQANAEKWQPDPITDDKSTQLIEHRVTELVPAASLQPYTLGSLVWEITLQAINLVTLWNF